MERAFSFVATNARRSPCKHDAGPFVFLYVPRVPAHRNGCIEKGRNGIPDIVPGLGYGCAAVSSPCLSHSLNLSFSFPIAICNVFFSRYTKEIITQKSTRMFRVFKFESFWKKTSGKEDINIQRLFVNERVKTQLSLNQHSNRGILQWTFNIHKLT